MFSVAVEENGTGRYREIIATRLEKSVYKKKNEVVTLWSHISLSLTLHPPNTKTLICVAYCSRKSKRNGSKESPRPV